ncbi:MAG: CoA transferase [Deltaproteobacteria bacterium]|nr:CoA transferase [Deltaproteobacteria bacterium]
MPENDPRPLAGVTIVDLTRVLAGPYCTLVLSNLGARVIKVERPVRGDDVRDVGPFRGGFSLYFAALNYDKESIEVDLKSEAGRSVFERLLDRADVLVENFRPGTLEKLGYGWEALHARWPRLIYGAASGFGHTGPMSRRPAYDLVAQAMSGMMSLTGYPDQPPARVGVSIGDMAAALFLSVGLCAALYKRRETGQGVMVDVAMLDAQIAILENALTRHLVTGDLPQRTGTRHPNISPFQAFETSDGRLVVCAGHDELYHVFCDKIGRPEMKSDPRFVTADDRRVNVAAMQEEVESVLRTRPTAHWLEVFEAAGTPCAPVNTVADAVRLPQVEAREMLRAIPDPRIGTLWVAGNPIKISGVAEPATHRPPPDVGADGARILAELD